MKGLLVKDLRLVLQQKKFFLILLVVAAILNFQSDGTFIMGYLTAVCSVFVLSLNTYDENDNGYLFLMTLPVTRRAFALEKYVFSILFGSCAWTVGFLISFTARLCNGTVPPLPDFLADTIVLIPLFSLIVSILLPFQFKFGAEKGKIAALVAFVICFLIVVLCTKGFDSAGIDVEAYFASLSSTYTAFIDLAMFAAAAVAAAISCTASIHILQKKEF